MEAFFMEGKAGSNLNDRQYKVVVASNSHFPSHIHNVYEVLCVREGSAKAEINGKKYLLEKGQGLAVFPLEYHSYTVDVSSCVEIFIFSPHFIGEFQEQAAGRKPVDACLNVSDIPSFPTDSSNILCIKSFFYDLCSKLLDRVCLTQSIQEGSDLSLLDKLFLFVDKHYQAQCTLADAAQSLKYDYTYLSKLFKSKTGMRFNDYVNQFRIGHANYLLYSSDKSVTEIAYDVGYNSVRTFNWEFQKIMHTTPAKYQSVLKR